MNESNLITEDKNQIIVLDGENWKVVHLGGCKNPNQAEKLLTEAAQAKKIIDPQYALIVPKGRIFKFTPKTTFELVPTPLPIPGEPTPAAPSKPQ